MKGSFGESRSGDDLPCRYCKHPVPRGSKRCPYCGVLNPTLRTRTVVVLTLLILGIMYLYTRFVHR